MVPEHASKVRFASLTTHFVSISLLLRSISALRWTQNCAVSSFYALFCRREHRVARFGQHDGLIPCQLSIQSGLTLPENRPSLD